MRSRHLIDQTASRCSLGSLHRGHPGTGTDPASSACPTPHASNREGPQAFPLNERGLQSRRLPMTGSCRSSQRRSDSDAEGKAPSPRPATANRTSNARCRGAQSRCPRRRSMLEKTTYLQGSLHLYSMPKEFRCALRGAATSDLCWLCIETHDGIGLQCTRYQRDQNVSRLTPSRPRVPSITVPRASGHCDSPVDLFDGIRALARPSWHEVTNGQRSRPFVASARQMLAISRTCPIG
jgi:hypothetical protein